MNRNSSKFLYEALTYDDVLLVPGYSEVLPRETKTSTQLTKKNPTEYSSGIRCHGHRDRS